MSSVITSRTNARVKQLRAALSGNARLAGGLLAIEGEHLIVEALQSQLPLHTVFVAQGREHLLSRISVPAECEILILAADVFLSATEAPQGIAALLAPPMHSFDDLLKGSPLVLVVEALQDPGNLGTLIRSAEAFGANGVLALPGTVSPWNQKALRASAGSALRLPVVAGDIASIDLLRRQGLRILAAVPSDGIPATQCGLVEPCALLLGNEGAGLTPELLSLADERVTIPTPGPTESLNAAVAGSILLYEAARQRS